MSATAPQPGAAGPSDGSGRDRYLVGAAEPAMLRDLAGRFGTGAALDVTAALNVIRTIGEPPSALVVEATQEAIEKLWRAGNGLLLVEPDTTLAEPGPIVPPGIPYP